MSRKPQVGQVRSLGQARSLGEKVDALTSELAEMKEMMREVLK